MWFTIPLCCAALVCSVTALGIPYWAVYDHKLIGRINFGIFQVYNPIVGWEFTAPTGSMIAVRVLQSLGTLLLLVSLVLAVVKQCSETARPALFKIAARLEVLAGFMILIGVTIFGILKEVQTYSNGTAIAENYIFHAGFYLAIVAGILSFVAAIALTVDTKVADLCREKTQEKELTAVSDSSQERRIGHHGYTATRI